MSVSKMEKLTAILPREDADALLRRLMRLRAVSLIDTVDEDDASDAPALEADVSGAAERVARVEAVLPILAKRSTRKLSLFRQQTRVSHSDFRADGRYEFAWKVVAQVEKLLAEQKELRAERDELRGRLQGYIPYLEYERRLDATVTAHTQTVLGAFPGGTSGEAVVKALDERAAVVQVLSEDGAGLYVSVLVHRAEQDSTMRALSGIGFLPASFADTDGTAKELFDRADRERVQLDERLQQCERRLCALAERIEEVEILSDIEGTTLLAEKQKASFAPRKNARCFAVGAPCTSADA